jgi:polysaccharide deacetylase family protein (PEP-CTERM system associated)
MATTRNPALRAQPTNALTIDVEDWFQVENYKAAIRRTEWEGLDRRVVRNTDRLLDLFAAAGVHATFFVLGWVAFRHPDLIRRIVAGGHELASHGYGHARVVTLSPLAFRKDIRAAKRLLEDQGGIAVRGYRAPTFSMSPASTPWAYEILAETGHGYSSSVFPGRHEGAGSAELAPFRDPRSGLVEIPMTAIRAPLLAGRTVPASGGGWFRIMPYPIFAALLRQVHREERRGNFYLHPWEIDPGQPRPAGVAALPARKHRIGLHSTEARLMRLLRDFSFGRMDAVFADALAPAAAGNGLPLRAAA